MKIKLIATALIAGFIAFLISDLVMASALANPYVNLGQIATPFAFIIGLVVTNIFITIFAVDSTTNEEYLSRIPNIKIG
jgi:hypothetical protein